MATKKDKKDKKGAVKEDKDSDTGTSYLSNPGTQDQKGDSGIGKYNDGSKSAGDRFTSLRGSDFKEASWFDNPVYASYGEQQTSASVDQILHGLFSPNKEDKRVKFFVDILRNAWENSGKLERIQIDKVPIIFSPKYFTRSNESDKAIHNSWIQFFHDIAIHMHGHNSATQRYIKEIAESSAVKSHELGSHDDNNFIQAVLRTFIDVNNKEQLSHSKVDVYERKYKTLNSKQSTKTIMTGGAVRFTSQSQIIFFDPIDMIDNLFSAKPEIEEIKNILKESVKNILTEGGEVSDKIDFEINYNGEWLKDSLEEHLKNTRQFINNSVSKFLSEEIPLSQSNYFRKGPNLYMLGDNGQDVQVDMNSAAFKALTESDKCMGTGFADQEDKSCADYLRDCLSGQSIEKCKTYLQEANFWTRAADEVGKMLPPIAIQTLSAFEFQMERKRDDGNKFSVLQYQSVNSWLKNLHEMARKEPHKLSDDDVLKISKNDKLIGYLGMLVNKINSSPQILNPNLGNSPISLTEKKGKLNLHYDHRDKSRYQNTPSTSDIDRLANGLSENLRVEVSLPGLFGAKIPFRLNGGGSYINSLENKLSNRHQFTSQIINSHYAALVHRLNNLGKEISLADAKKIHELINQLENSEEKLYKLTLYMEKYASLLELHGEKDNNDVLSVDNLKEFVDNRNKYFERVSKKQTNLISIIRALAEAVSKESKLTPNSTSPHAPNVDMSKIL